MRLLSWLEAVRGRFTERETATRRRAARLPVAGQLEQLEAKSLLSVSALFVNGELNIFSDSSDDITVGSAGSGAGTTVQVLANGTAVSSVGSVLTSSVTSFVIQGGNLANTIDLSTVSIANYPNLAAINVDGGHGSDTILGSDGIAETLLGNHGDDVITCLDGASSINGNDGNDTIVGGGGNDTINGEDGDDSIDGGDGDDIIIGHDGNDTIDGGAGNDNVTGGEGNDLIAGSAGLDTLNGMMGADSIDGGDGNDSVLGGAGDDSLSGGLGDDSLLGNDGADTLQGGDDNDSLDGGNDADTIQGEDGNDTLNGSGGNDSLQGNNGEDSIFGGAGKDTLDGNLGSDTLRGQSGNDTLFGGDGFDMLDGGTGNDVLNAEEVPTPPAPPPPLPVRLFAVPTNNRNQIVELDPQTGAELNRFAAPEPTSVNGDGLAFDGNSLYYLNGFGTNTLYRLDPGTGIVLDSTVIPRPANQRYDALAFLNGLLYIQDSANDDILVFDPALGGVSTVLDINGANPNTNLAGGLAGATNPDRLIATVANGRSIVEINPLTGLITDTFSVTTTSAGTYSGVGVLDDNIFLGSSRVSTATALSVTSSLDIFNRDGSLLRTITLPYGVSAFGADDIGTIGVPIGAPGQFDIVLDLPAGLSASDTAAFDAAEVKWESIIRGDLPDVIVANVGTIDDLVITVRVMAIDGPGGVLGQTGIDVQRTGSFLPAMASITIDSADLTAIEADGSLSDVILHEIGHALGFGTVWVQQGLIASAGTSNPRFVGAQATAEYDRVFRSTEPNVPVENVGGTGSAGSHWRESKFGNELMSSVIGAGSNPLSRVTVAALADMGYQVDFGQADPFTPSTAGLAGASASSTLAAVSSTTGVSARPRGTWQIANNPVQLVQPLTRDVARLWTVGYMGSVANHTRPGGPTSGAGLVAVSSAASGRATIAFDEVPALTPANGQSILGATFGFKVAGIDSTDARLNFSIGAAPGLSQFLTDPVLEGNALGVLTVDFTSPATTLSFGVERNRLSSIPNGVAVTLFDSNLNVIASSAVNLQLSLAYSEGSFSYTGTTAVRRMRLDFTSAPTSTGGDRFAIDNLSFSLATPPTAVNGDTLLGGSGDDTLFGSARNDVLNGGVGNDQLEGGDGDDSLVGAAGNDSIQGQGGNDTLRGGAGKDTVLGGDGDDSIIAALGDGVDSIVGGEGSDSFEFFGSNSANTFNVGQAAGLLTVSIDTTTQSLSSDIELVQVTARGGTDRINVADLSGVGATEVRLNAGTGNDRVLADAGAKLGGVLLRVFGEAGNDSLVGTNSAELLSGGDGNDTLVGNDGNDKLNGDAGDDSISGGAGNDVIDGGDGLSTIDGGDGDDSLTGSILNDVINGGAGNDTLVGLNGNDVLNGMEGNDSLAGGSGDDNMDGGAGDDTLDGGTDNDTINGNDGNDLVNGFHGDDSILGGLGDDTISGDDGNDTILGEDGHDLINGGDGNDVVQGNAGDDVILGSDGNDTLRGGAGRDTLLGGDGNDNVDGQGGTDTVAGNQGDDTVTGVAGEIKESFQLDPVLLTKLL